MTTNDGIMNNTTLPAAASASASASRSRSRSRSSAVRSSTIRSSTATLKLNQGRIYDCGRVPPIPKQLQRKQQKKQQQHPSSLLSTMTTTSESSSDKDDEHPSADINHHDDDDDNDNTSSLLHYFISSHTNKRRGSFSKSGWLRRIVRGQIRIRIENGSTSIIMTNPCYKILTRENVKQQIVYYRRPWYEPIIQVKVALLEDVDVGVDIDIDIENKRITNHNNNNNINININNNRNIDDDDDENVLKILYIDNHIMAVHKPSGLPTMPSQTYYEYSVLNTLRRLYNNNHDNDNDIDNNRNRPCKNKSVTMSSEDDDDDDVDDDVNMNRNVKELIQKYCSAPPQPVHRLGVGTSGILLIATSFIGRQQLTKSIRSKTEKLSSKNRNKKFKSSDCCRKIYRALVYAYRNDNRSSLSSSSSNSNDNNDATTIKKILIPDFMTIDCPIGPTPFPIGGGTIHAACPSYTTATTNTKENDEQEEEESLSSSLLYGHVHVHKNDSAFHDDHDDPDGGYSAAADNNDNVDVNQAKNKDKNIKSALSYVKVIRRNINICPTNTENGNNDDNDNDGYPHHKSSSSSKLLSLDNTALVEIEIPTGRPHQIRIHMSYAGYALVDDPLYLPGGIPSHEKKQFPIRRKEDEDIETDIEDEEEKEEHTSNETTTTSRVPLPRDCGYHLHAYQISIENPSFLSSKKDTNATSVDHDGHDYGNGIDSKSATAATTKEKMMMMTFTAPPPAILR